MKLTYVGPENSITECDSESVSKQINIPSNSKSCKILPNSSYKQTDYISVKRQLSCALAFAVVSIKYTEYCLVKFLTLFICFRKEIKQLTSQSIAELFFSSCCGVYQIHRILLAKVHDIISLPQKENQVARTDFCP